MQTQHKNALDSQQNRPLVEPGNSRKWLAGLSAFVVVLLVVGVSIFVFAAARQHQGSQHPPTGQWKQVQSGYLFLSMQAAPSNPAVLYACASTSAAVSNTQDTSVIILHSTDFGDHWQDVGATAGLGSYCELAVNPTNENDIYVISTNLAPQSNATLKHSTDGGQTWTTVAPAFSPPLRVPGSKTTLPWFVQQLRYDGHSLYGVQWITTGSPAIPSPPPFFNRLPRLVTSSDGGHTWSIIDGQFTAKGLGAQAYTLDPTHPGTIYEIAGHPWFPVETAPVPTSPPTNIQPKFGLDQQLFKTTDNGASWQSLLTGLPYGSQVQLASANPNIVYAGGLLGPLPLVLPSQPGRGTVYQPAPFTGLFRLQVSTNGGVSWQQVTAPPNEQIIQGWFVSADGHVFTSPTISFSSPGGGPTAIAGTAIVGTAVPATPVLGTPLPVKTGAGGLPDIQSTLPVPHPSIQSYDLASHTWSQVTTPPANGRLLQVTPADTHGGAILWFVGLQAQHYMLYRFTV
jgi:hypothetical protein